MKIAMVVHNDLARDSRVQKEAKSLMSEGHGVRVFALASSLYPPGARRINGIDVYHVAIPNSAISIKPSHLITAQIKRYVRLLKKLIHRKKPKITRPSIEQINKIDVYHVAIPNSAISTKPSHLITAQIKRYVRLLKKLIRKIILKIMGPFVALLVRHRFAKAVMTPLTEWQPDVVHCHDLETTHVALRYRRREKIRFVYDSHELWQSRNSPIRRHLFSSVFKIYERMLERKCLEVSDLVITVSPGIGEILCRNDTSIAKKLIIIKNVPQGTTQMASRRISNDNNSRPEVYYSGRITIGRNLEKLIYASSEYGLEIKINLLGYGAPAYVEKIESLAVLNNVDLKVIPAVEPEAVCRTLSNADAVFVGVDPIVESYRLSLPNKFFEALLSGRPVVAPSLPEMMNFAAGISSIFWYDPKDLNSIAESLTKATRSDFNADSIRQERDKIINWKFEAETLLSGYSRLITKN
jgi:glycosyltransferase involved in cell wall biosynthesis